MTMMFSFGRKILFMSKTTRLQPHFSPHLQTLHLLHLFVSTLANSTASSPEATMLSASSR